MVTRWSRSTSNFYALIGQNLTGEFMRKIYAASDRVLCQNVMFFLHVTKTGNGEPGAGNGSLGTSSLR